MVRKYSVSIVTLIPCILLNLQFGIWKYFSFVQPHQNTCPNVLPRKARRLVRNAQKRTWGWKNTYDLRVCYTAGEENDQNFIAIQKLGLLCSSRLNILNFHQVDFQPVIQPIQTDESWWEKQILLVALCRPTQDSCGHAKICLKFILEHDGVLTFLTSKWFKVTSQV